MDRSVTETLIYLRRRRFGLLKKAPRLGTSQRCGHS